MKKELVLVLSPREAADPLVLKKSISEAVSQKISSLTGYTIVKHSIDARGDRIKVRLAVHAFFNEVPIPIRKDSFFFKDVTHAEKSAIIIGGGPAGLFAALKLLEAGIKPIILERGKDIRTRRRDLAQLNKNGLLDPDSNYCFGEGGAGTYSDGKLYTRSNKRGDLMRILQLFVHFGADESILFEAHPHIGTNKLPNIISAMRQTIEGHGGKVLFQKRVTDLTIENGKIGSVHTASGETYTANNFILATGHSARDIFELLNSKNIEIQAKPFALGLRVEHPQENIDLIQYHDASERQWLPPASYSLVQQIDNRGVFSFCMCPGGIIAPAATSQGELVVNGWSPSKRNNPYANSGMVVQVSTEDAYREVKHLGIKQNDPLLFMHFQKMVEVNCFNAGGGNFIAPAQRLVDFADKKSSTILPSCSYGPGINSVMMNQILPGFIYESLAKSFRSFGKKMNRNMNSYFTNEAIVVATESRTSSPVRIPRDASTLVHPQISNLYPCGEGAGYAGGIVSAAMDGEKVAEKIAINK